MKQLSFTQLKVIRRIVTFWVCLLSFTNIQAQEKLTKRHEFYFGAGLFNAYLMDKYDKLTKPIPYNGDSECFAVEANLSLDYKYLLTKRFSVGISAGFTNEDHTNYIDYDYSEYDVTKTEDHGYSSASLIYAMPTIHYTWYQTENGIFRAYSGAGLGLALLKEKITVSEYQCNKTKADLAYNVTLAGIAVGGPTFKFFTEMNGGCKGMLTMGLLLRL